MRRWTALIAWIMLIAMALTGCGPLVEDAPKDVSIVASFYPVYALTEALTRDVPGVRLSCLVAPQDGCLRDYQLSDRDIYRLAGSADAVILGGCGLESFEGTLFGLGEAGPAVMALLYNLELYNEADSAHHDSEEDSHLAGPNPHLYMSVDGAMEMIETAAALLETLDPEYEEAYSKNMDSAIESLEALKSKAAEIVGNADGTPVILMNEALIYVAGDYGFEVADWLDRESGVNYYDTELEECLERLAKSGAKLVLIEKQAPKPLVDALEAAGFSVARIDIFSTQRDPNGFDNYIRVQTENARAIRKALDAIQKEAADD